MVPRKRFYEDLKGLHKTFGDATKKFENKNLTGFLFQYNFQKCMGRLRVNNVHKKQC